MQHNCKIVQCFFDFYPITLHQKQKLIIFFEKNHDSAKLNNSTGIELPSFMIMATFGAAYLLKNIDYKSSNKKYKLNRLFREYPRHSLWSKCRGVVVYTPRHTDGISQNKTRVRSRHDRHSGKIRVFNVALFLVFPNVWCKAKQKVKLIVVIFL